MAEPIIKLGSKGDAVKRAQKALIERYHLPLGTDDGISGPVTQNAVRNYQTDRSAGHSWAFSFPLKVDGIVGPGDLVQTNARHGQEGLKGLKSYADPQLDPGAVDGELRQRQERQQQHVCIRYIRQNASILRGALENAGPGSRTVCY